MRKYVTGHSDAELPQIRERARARARNSRSPMGNTFEWTSGTGSWHVHEFEATRHRNVQLQLAIKLISFL